MKQVKISVNPVTVTNAAPKGPHHKGSMTLGVMATLRREGIALPAGDPLARRAWLAWTALAGGGVVPIHHAGDGVDQWGRMAPDGFPLDAGRGMGVCDVVILPVAIATEAVRAAVRQRNADRAAAYHAALRGVPAHVPVARRKAAAALVEHLIANAGACDPRALWLDLMPEWAPVLDAEGKVVVPATAPLSLIPAAKRPQPVTDAATAAILTRAFEHGIPVSIKEDTSEDGGRTRIATGQEGDGRPVTWFCEVASRGVPVWTLWLSGEGVRRFDAARIWRKQGSPKEPKGTNVQVFIHPKRCPGLWYDATPRPLAELINEGDLFP